MVPYGYQNSVLRHMGSRFAYVARAPAEQVRCRPSALPCTLPWCAPDTPQVALIGVRGLRNLCPNEFKCLSGVMPGVRSRANAATARVLTM
jgi:hypothetical protein